MGISGNLLSRGHAAPEQAEAAGKAMLHVERMPWSRCCSMVSTRPLRRPLNTSHSEKGTGAGKKQADSMGQGTVL